MTDTIAGIPSGKWWLLLFLFEGAGLAESQIDKEACAETPNFLYSLFTRQQLEALLKELRICKSLLLARSE